MSIPDGVIMGQLRYVEIYEQFKRMILEGKMVEHQKLPSKRKLAENLKVSPLTVEAGY
jgi:GntR family transcriptional regulator/MocR family aminotransferase